MKEVNLEKWARKDIFNLYYQYDIPQISLCTPLEVSKVYAFAKKKKISFYFCLCHVFYTALLKFDEFLMRMVNNKLVVEDCEYANVCALKPGEEIFKVVVCKYNSNIEKFCNKLSQNLNNQTDFMLPTPKNVRHSQNIAYISCTPWFEFSHITHPQDVKRNEFIPHISFDKMKINEKNERWVNVSLQINHSVIDGVLVAKLLNEVKSIINELS